MAPVKKIKTYSRSSTSLVNNSVDAFNVLFANNMAKRILGRTKKKKSYLIKQLAPRKNTESLLADESFDISTEDTFDKLFKNSKQNPKPLPNIHISNISKSADEKSSCSSLIDTSHQKRLKFISDSNSLQTVEKDKTDSYERSHLKRLQQTSIDKIEDSLEVENVERNLNTSLSYIKIPKTTKICNETSTLEVTADYFSRTLKQKLTTHCSTPIAPFKQVKLTNQTISPIKVNSLLQQTFKEIENWDNEFPITNKNNTVSKTKYYSLRSLFKDSHQKSIFTNLYEDSMKIPNIFKTSKKQKFITLRRKNLHNSSRKQSYKSNSTKKNLTVSLESFTNFEIQNMSSYNNYKLKESFLSQLSLVNYVTKETIEKSLEKKQNKKSSYLFDMQHENDGIIRDLSKSTKSQRISKELRVRIPRISTEFESVTSSESSFENFYSKNINSHLSDLDDSVDSCEDCNKKDKSLVIKLSKPNIVYEDFEKFYSSHVKADSSNKPSKSLRSNNSFTANLCINNWITLTRQHSKEDVFENFYAKNFTVTSKGDCSSDDEDSIKSMGCKDLKVNIQKELLKDNSKEDGFKSFYESNVHLKQNKSCTTSKDNEVQKPVKYKDLRIEIHDLANLKYKETIFENFFTKNISLTTNTHDSSCKDENNIKNDIEENTVQCKDLNVNIADSDLLNIDTNNINYSSHNEARRKSAMLQKDLKVNIKQLSRKTSEEDTFEHFYAYNLNLVHNPNIEETIEKPEEYENIRVDVYSNGAASQKIHIQNDKNTPSQNKPKNYKGDIYCKQLNDNVKQLSKINSKEDIFENFCTNNLNLIKQKDYSLINAQDNLHNILISKNTHNSSGITISQDSSKNINSNKILKVHLIRHDYTSVYNDKSTKEIANVHSDNDSSNIKENSVVLKNENLISNLDENTCQKSCTYNINLKKTLAVHLVNNRLSTMDGTPFDHNEEISDSISKLRKESLEVDIVQTEQFETFYKDNYGTYSVPLPTSTVNIADESGDSNIIENSLPEIYVQNGTYWKHIVKSKSEINLSSEVECLKKNVLELPTDVNVSEEKKRKSNKKFLSFDNLQSKSNFNINKHGNISKVTTKTGNQLEIADKTSVNSELVLNGSNEVDPQSSVARFEVGENIQVTTKTVYNSTHMVKNINSELINSTETLFETSAVQIDLSLINDNTTTQMGVDKKQQNLSRSQSKLLIKDVDSSVAKTSISNLGQNKDSHLIEKPAFDNCLDKNKNTDNAEIDLKLTVPTTATNENSSGKRRGRPKSKISSNGKRKRVSNLSTSLLHVTAENSDDSFCYHNKKSNLEKGDEIQNDLGMSEDNIEANSNQIPRSKVKKKSPTTRQGWLKNKVEGTTKLFKSINTNITADGMEKINILGSESINNVTDLTSPDSSSAGPSISRRTRTASKGRETILSNVNVKSSLSNENILNIKNQLPLKRRGRPRKKPSDTDSSNTILNVDENVQVLTETVNSNGIENTNTFQSHSTGKRKSRRNVSEGNTTKNSFINADVEIKSPRKQKTKPTKLEVNSTIKTTGRSSKSSGDLNEFVHVTAETSDIDISKTSRTIETKEDKVKNLTGKSTHTVKSPKHITRSTKLLQLKLNSQKHLDAFSDSKVFSLKNKNTFKTKAKRKNQESNDKSVSKILSNVIKSNEINVKSKGIQKSNIPVSSELVNEINNSIKDNISKSKQNISKSNNLNPSSSVTNSAAKVNQEILNISSGSECLSPVIKDSSRPNRLSSISTERIDQKPANVVIDLTTVDNLNLGLDKDGFKVPQCIKSPKNIVLKAGKSWRRSLSIHKRSSLFLGFRKEEPGSPLWGKTCPKGKLSRLPSQKCPRRLSVRFVAVKHLPFLHTETDSTILGEYAVNTSYVPDQILEASLEDSFRCLSLNQSQRKCSIKSQLGVPVTAKEIVLRKCGQTEPIQFSKCFPDSSLQNCQKIGEGVYGEVFLFRNPNGGTSVLKIVPVEGDQLVNGERQKKFEEVLSEIIITIELSNLRNNKRNGISAFTEVQKIQCVQGRYPEKLLDLWDLFDETRGSENDCPDIFGDEQLYIIFQMAYGGRDMESFIFNSAMQGYSMFQQVALALAIAEEELHFEHRDLHWGNVLVTAVEANKVTSFNLENKTYEIPTMGVEVAIIDYTLSRIEHDGVVIFNDLGLDPDLFTAEGDYQFEVYRLMQEKNRNNWKEFEPFSNLLWLHYILEKAITALRYRNLKTKRHKEYLRKLKMLKEDILSYNNVKDFVVANLLDI